MNKKKIGLTLGALAILGGGAYYAVPVIQGDTVTTSETMKMKEFEKLEDLKFEVLDTAAFSDKNLEKWFEENKVKEGEHLYFDNKHTYVLISPGKDSKGEDTIWFDGLKKSGKDGLIVGYEFVNAADLGIAVKEGELRTLLVRTEGEFKKATGLAVEKEQQEIKVTPVEEVPSEDKSADKDVKEDVKEESQTSDAKSDEKTDEKKEASDKKDKE